jgi:AAA+ superfamily predicted ATPase
LPDKLPVMPDVSPETLAALSEGLSGGDILNCVILAASSALDGGSAAVALADFETALEQVRRARDEVGTGGRYALE